MNKSLLQNEPLDGTFVKCHVNLALKNTDMDNNVRLTITTALLLPSLPAPTFLNSCFFILSKEATGHIHQ